VKGKVLREEAPQRQVAVSIEVTGLESDAGHRIIELACVELVDRQVTGRTFHRYLNPERNIDLEMQRVHGLNSEFLAGMPRFAEIAEEAVEFFRSAELVMHNAQFDIAFLNSELQLALFPAVGVICSNVIDTLRLAQVRHPGRRNSLSALCKRYRIELRHLAIYGAPLDAFALAQVYLEMTRRLVH
jgi:DNA polymerase III subunit epsilon